MSDKLISVALMAAYVPLVAMAVLWIIAFGLKLAGMPALLLWLKARTSIPQPEPNPPPGARREVGS
jgi:hypothetical protein